MDKIVNTYFVQSIALIAGLTLPAALFVALRGGGGLAMPLCVVVVFQLVACLAYGLVWKTVARTSTDSLPTLYMVAAGCRMFAAVAVVIGFLFLVNDADAVRFFVITFLIYYFLILVYDTMYFVKVEKRFLKNG